MMLSKFGAASGWRQLNHEFAAQLHIILGCARALNRPSSTMGADRISAEIIRAAGVVSTIWEDLQLVLAVGVGKVPANPITVSWADFRAKFSGDIRTGVAISPDVFIVRDFCTEDFSFRLDVNHFFRAVRYLFSWINQKTKGAGGYVCLNAAVRDGVVCVQIRLVEAAEYFALGLVSDVGADEIDDIGVLIAKAHIDQLGAGMRWIRDEVIRGVSIEFESAVIASAEVMQVERRNRILISATKSALAARLRHCGLDAVVLSDHGTFSAVELESADLIILDPAERSRINSTERYPVLFVKNDYSICRRELERAHQLEGTSKELVNLVANCLEADDLSKEGTLIRSEFHAVPSGKRSELRRMVACGLIQEIAAWANLLRQESTSPLEKDFADAVLSAVEELDLNRLEMLAASNS